MNASHTNPSFLPTLAGLLLAGTALGRSGSDFTPLSAEAEGTGSGDQVAPQLALVLELVGGQTATPCLRLSGGLPGNRAVLALSLESEGLPAAGESPRYVAPGAQTVSGSFDLRGTFELPLSSFGTLGAGGLALRAQGAEVGQGFSHVLEVSHGLRVFATPDESAERLVLLPTRDAQPGEFYLSSPRTNLGPDRWEEARDGFVALGQIESAGDLLLPGLEDWLASTLNTAGDKLQCKLEAQLTCAIYAFLNVGGKLELELELERQLDGGYELHQAREMDATAGVEAKDDLEVEAASGLKIVDIYRYDTIPALARGIRGLALARIFPDLTPYGNDHGIPAFQPLVIAQNALHAALEGLDVAQVLKSHTKKAMDAAWSDYVHASFPPKKALCLAVYLAKKAIHQSVSQLVDFAVVQVQKVGEELATVARSANALWQLRNFVHDHRIAYELDSLVLGAEASASLAPVDVGTLDLGVAIERQDRQKVRFGVRQAATDPWSVTLSAESSCKIEGVAALVGGGKLVSERKLEHSIGCDFATTELTGLDLNQIVHAVLAAPSPRLRLALSSDTQLTGLAGLIAYRETGFGRQWSIALEDSTRIPAYLLSIGQWIARADLHEAPPMPETSVRFSIQDRRCDGYGLQLGASYAGYGGGIEGSAMWMDAGRGYSRSVEAAALPQLIEGAAASVQALVNGG